MSLARNNLKLRKNSIPVWDIPKLLFRQEISAASSCVCVTCLVCECRDGCTKVSRGRWEKTNICRQLRFLFWNPGKETFCRTSRFEIQHRDKKFLTQRTRNNFISLFIYVVRETMSNKDNRIGLSAVVLNQLAVSNGHEHSQNMLIEPRTRNCQYTTLAVS